MYNSSMRYEWDPEKNEWLKQERNISFEQIIFHLSQGDIWRISDHPDQDNYPDQRLYFVEVENYIYIVPHIIEKDYIQVRDLAH